MEPGARNRLIDALLGLYPADLEERADVERMLHLAAGLAEPFSREQLPAHFTASAAVVDPSGRRICLVDHVKLGRRLQPGGHVEPDDESPAAAALREVREETGLVPARLYAVAVQPFFMRPVRTVQLSIVFAAFVDEPADVRLGPEHQAHAWLTVDQAMARFVWPSERSSMQQIVQLLGDGDAGPVEDVLRVV